MNKLFVDDLVESLESCTSTGVKVCEQKDVKTELVNQDLLDRFPMISFEKTNDSQFLVDVDESKFLNDPGHQGSWILASDWDDVPLFIINLKSKGNILYIDALEVNVDERGQGLGGRVVSIIENVACNYFDYVVISPFDTDAINFWEHMGYIEDDKGNWVRDLTK